LGPFLLFFSGTNLRSFSTDFSWLGAPPAADAAQLVIAMSGDLRSKREVAFLFVPAIGKKVIDLGGNVEKGLH